MQYSAISNCEVCGSDSLDSVLNLGEQPLCDDLIPIGDDREPVRYPLEILFCGGCLTAHQRFQVRREELFPASYHYRAKFTEDVLSGMSDLVADAERRIGSLANKTVLDVGCNDGSLLAFFASKGARTIGVEPTLAAEEARLAGHTVYQSFFDSQTSSLVRETHGFPDIISFTNVFAHISDLPALLEAVTSLMSETTVLIVENHYLGSVLVRNQFDTFYHEHPRTYSLNSFIEIASKADLIIDEVAFPSRYGGNIRVFMRKNILSEELSAEIRDLAEKEESTFAPAIQKLQAFVTKWKEEKRLEIQHFVDRYGPLAAKAFPGRASILITSLGLDSSQIRAIYEKPGSLKLGHYVPGTRIPIVSDELLAQHIETEKVILNLAWHIRREIHSYLVKLGFRGQTIDIVDS